MERLFSLNVPQDVWVDGGIFTLKSLFEMFKTADFYQINSRFQISPDREIHGI